MDQIENKENRKLSIKYLPTLIKLVKSVMLQVEWNTEGVRIQLCFTMCREENLYYLPKKTV